MKMLGVKNRCRLYEIPSDIEYIMAKPRMKKYIEYSANVYAIYLKYIAKEDIHVYSIDEAFLDITSYLKVYNMTSLDLAKTIMKDIYITYGITATCGIGTNLYLAKIALDMMSKHNASNIGWLNEERYRKLLWHHKPLKDFWQIGDAIEKRLNKHRLYDMYDVAHCKPEILYKEFGINAEFLIDHSWGKEICTIADIKLYKPNSNSISTNQVLFEDYSFDKAKIVLKEMVEVKSLNLIEQDLVTDKIQLYIGYSNNIMKASVGSGKLINKTNVYSELVKEFLRLYDRIVSRNAPIRRIGIAFLNIRERKFEQISFFVDYNKLRKERDLENAINIIKNKMGKNLILRGTNLEEGATAIGRNKMIGGHNA